MNLKGPSWDLTQGDLLSQSTQKDAETAFAEEEE